MTARDIRWDTNGTEIMPLPTAVEIPEEINEENISDWLSDEFGFCHFGYVLER